MKVLCFGSLNIDYTYKVNHFVKKGETLSSDSLQVFSGGRGLSAAPERNQRAFLYQSCRLHIWIILC